MAKSSSQNQEFLTRKEAAEFLRCHESTIHRWRVQGIINAHGIGGKVLYKKSELLEKTIEL